MQRTYLGSHKDDRHDLIDSPDTTGVDLTDADCARGDELLEKNAVCTVLSGSNQYTQRGHGACDGEVAQHII